LRDAVQRGASHVHLEPAGVRLRIDGRRVSTSHLYSPAVVRRFKALADLDTTERTLPQRGKASMQLGDRSVELLVDAIPAFDGTENVVLQLLRPLQLRHLSELGLSEANRRNIGALIEKPSGLFLCAGPSGSGKTTTLHAILDALNSPDVKLCAAEERVEITQPGITQVEVKPRAELTFAHAIRAFARADADVILAGDLRDLETARAAIEAAQRGKRVFAALPTKSAAETVLRVLGLGVDPFELADSLLGVLAQRLVKKLCSSCKRKRAVNADELAVTAESYGLEPFPPGTELWTAPGCTACNGAGYQGYVAVQELLVVSDELKRAIARRAPAGEIEKLARAARTASMTEDAVQKVLGGQTDLRQVATAR
jgi:type II secretory ATPase GspE/PulE/Tfp pilus assembly ATPase PilB-like protein